ncbi:MAG: SLC13 family permease [Planctomycetota bacterium]|jgi:di/tricarboxylate transporter
MTTDQVVVVLVLGGAVVLFVTELVPLGVTGLGIVVALGLTGVLDAEAVTSAFASPALILVASLYIVSASLIRTGVIAAAGMRLMQLGRGSELRLLVVTMLVAAVFSTLLNNTSVVVLMMPILLGIAQRSGIAPSRLLIPMSYAAILGGMMTLIGTSTNILVADLAEREAPHMEPLGFFEFLPVGAGFAVVGMLYMWTFGRRLLPARPTVSSITRGRPFEYVSELRVPAAGPAVGMSVFDIGKEAGEKIRILQLIHGEEVMERFPGQQRLVPGDILVLRGLPEAILTLQRFLRLEALPGATEGIDIPQRGTTFAEIAVTPASDLIGRTLADLGLHRRLGVVALALQRRGSHLRHGITQVPLRIGDVILVQGSPENVENLRGQPGLMLLVGVEERVHLRRRAPVAIAILVGFVFLATLRAADLPMLAIAAGTAAMLTGCISLRRAVREVDWNILALLAGSITLGTALHETGLAAKAAHLVVGATHDLGPYIVLSAIYFLTMITTEVISNAGAAALMIPIAMATATEMGASMRPFIFAVAFGASASFSTPIGYQTNAFILGPGGYRFRDFLRVGLPLQVLLWTYASVLIPLVFPFDAK